MIYLKFDYSSFEFKEHLFVLAPAARTQIVRERVSFETVDTVDMESMAARQEVSWFVDEAHQAYRAGSLVSFQGT